MFENLPGFREFYPEECSLRNFIFQLWRKSARDFGFVEFDAPILEPLDLFTEKSGPEIVSQLFAFEDRGGRSVALRPEMTPSLARLVGAKQNSLKRPVKWFNIGENFRYERMQKGRTRSFYQFNADILGLLDPAVDAELIALCVHVLVGFGLSEKDFRIRLSDRTLWMEYLNALQFEESEAAFALSVVDKMGREAQEQAEAKLKEQLGDRADGLYPKMMELAHITSLDGLQEFFEGEAFSSEREKLSVRLGEWERLLSHLNAMGVGSFIKIDLSIVRGLAYYTGFVFEAFEARGKGRAIAGGGRYDKLLEKYGYQAMPACGFAMGDVTLVDLLREKKRVPHLIQKIDIYVVIGGEKERPVALQVVSRLRQLGLSVEYALNEKLAFQKQFKAAVQSGARIAVILGGDEVAEGVVTLRDLANKNEVRIPADQLPAQIHGLLENGIGVE